MLDFTKLDNIETDVPCTYVVTISVHGMHYDIRYFDRKTAMENAEIYAECQDTDYVDILNGMTGEVLMHYKGQMF